MLSKVTHLHCVVEAEKLAPGHLLKLLTDLRAHKQLLHMYYIVSSELM